MAVEGDGVAAEHDELCTRIAELDEEVPEIVGELNHRSGRGTNRHGVSRRV